MSLKTEKKPSTHQIEIDEKIWEKVSRFSKIIKWNPERLIEHILDLEMFDYCQVGINSDSELSENLFHEFLKESFLKELTTII